MTRTTRRNHRKQSRRGSYLIEFALSVTLMVLLSCGVAAIGINLDRYLAVSHLAQYAADVFRSNAHLDNAAVRSVLLKATRGLGITSGSGQGVIILSEIQLGSASTNSGQPVITHRVVIGDSSIGASRIGSPNSVGSNGHVPDYDTNPSARASLPAGVILAPGQKLYAAEVVESGSGAAFPGLIQIERMRAAYFF